MTRCLLLLTMSLSAASACLSRTMDDADSLRRMLERVRTPVERIPLLIETSDRLLKSDLPASVHFAEEALRLAEAVGDEALVSRSLHVLGRASQLSGQLEKAVESHGRLYRMSVSSGHTEGVVKGLSGLALVHLTLKEYLRAQHILDQAWDLVRKSPDSGPAALPLNLRVRLHGYYAIALRGLDDFPNSSKHVEEGIRLSHVAGASDPEDAWLLLTCGQLLQESGRSDSARSLFMEAKRKSRLDGDLLGVSASSWCLGRLRESAGYMKEAKILYRESFLSAESAGFTRMAERAARNMAKVCQMLGEADSSLYHAAVADERRGYSDERKAATALTGYQRGITDAEVPATATPDFKSPSRFILAFALVSLALSGFLTHRLLRNGRNPVPAPTLGTPAPDSFMSLTAPDKNKEGAAALASGHGTEEASLIDRLTFNRHLQGVVDCLRGCINGVDADRQAEMRRLIREMEKTSDPGAWHEFESRLNSTYDGFIEKLRQLVPNLTQNERRLCLFLRMDMSTKDISRMTGQSVRAVELGRIRLRKKLNLTHSDAGLNEYLTSL